MEEIEVVVAQIEDHQLTGYPAAKLSPESLVGLFALGNFQTPRRRLSDIHHDIQLRRGHTV
jgi:hypothetical protein